MAHKQLRNECCIRRQHPRRGTLLAPPYDDVERRHTPQAIHSKLVVLSTSSACTLAKSALESACSFAAASSRTACSSQHQGRKSGLGRKRSLRCVPNVAGYCPGRRPVTILWRAGGRGGGIGGRRQKGGDTYLLRSKFHTLLRERCALVGQLQLHGSLTEGAATSTVNSSEPVTPLCRSLCGHARLANSNPSQDAPVQRSLARAPTSTERYPQTQPEGGSAAATGETHTVKQSRAHTHTYI